MMTKLMGFLKESFSSAIVRLCFHKWQYGHRDINNKYFHYRVCKYCSKEEPMNKL